MIDLPEKFLEDMKELLREEYDDFIESYKSPKTTGLRLNTLKIGKKEMLDLNLFELSPIEWTEDGFYYHESNSKPGKNPLHEAGAYYIQEPSAMSVVPKLDIEEGDIVLDMCAAPGGKSTYILSRLNNTGLLVSNEINSTRVRALGENLERFGAKNCIITNTDSERLNKVFRGYFDKVLIDAPCSGQGMFRKDEVAIKDWSYTKVIECQSIQRQLIRDGYDMLKKGGTLVYSTCTFSREENEMVIEEFIKEYPNAKLIDIKRLWPHKIKGEGHFVAKIHKLDEEKSKVNTINIRKMGKELKYYREFESKFLNIKLEDRFNLRGENLYLIPNNAPDTNGLKVLRCGLHVGILKKNRFEPSHALSHYIKKCDAKYTEDFSVDSQEVYQYLRGNTINTNQSRGWVLVTVEGIPLGWGKESNGVLKNHYPKGRRITY